MFQFQAARIYFAVVELIAKVVAHHDFNNVVLHRVWGLNDDRSIKQEIEWSNLDSADCGHSLWFAEAHRYDWIAVQA